MKSNQIWCVNYSHDWGVQWYIFRPTPCGPEEGLKGQLLLNFQLQSQFQRFLKQTFNVFSHIKDIKHIKQGFSFGLLGHAPGVVGLGVLRVKSLIFPKMWHIKLMGMINRTGHKRHFYPQVKPVTLGWDKRVKYH